MLQMSEVIIDQGCSVLGANQCHSVSIVVEAQRIHGHRIRCDRLVFPSENEAVSSRYNSPLLTCLTLVKISYLHDLHRETYCPATRYRFLDPVTTMHGIWVGQLHPDSH